jgi:hypothetical protein
LPQQQFRRLLESLHTNTSIKELQICHVQDDEELSWISNLLQRKTDFTYLRFWDCRIANIALLLSHGFTQLRKLESVVCAIGAEGVRLILEAIRDGDFPVLEDLGLQLHNDITATGLHWLAVLGPLALRRPSESLISVTIHTCLMILRLPNYLSETSGCQMIYMALKELRIRSCGEHVPIIIKACEGDKNTLQQKSELLVPQGTMGWVVVQRTTMTAQPAIPIPGRVQFSKSYKNGLPYVNRNYDGQLWLLGTKGSRR